MKKGVMKKFLSLIVIAAMVLALMPAFAPVSTSAATAILYDISASSVNIKEAGDYIISGTTQQNTIVIDAAGKTVNVTLRTANIQVPGCAFKIVGGVVNLILEGTSILKSSIGAGIENGMNVLNISGAGTLTALGAPNCAGIGGASGMAGGNITVNSGNISAKGGTFGAGIGGGFMAAGGNITINGGTVIANGDTNAAGIGGGFSGAGNKLVINGGNVTAVGGPFGAGIGGGINGVGNEITIGAGTVSAQGGQGSAGIGGGFNGTGASIIINGGCVKATAGLNAPNNIGGGDGKPAVTPKNAKGQDLFLVVKDMLSDAERNSLAQIDQGNPYYNMKDAIQLDNKYYLYLPKYAITYNNLNGAVCTNPTEYNIFSNIVLSDAVKASQTFYGWFSDLTAGSKITAIPAGSTGDKVLYARWTLVQDNAPVLNAIAPITIEYGKPMNFVVSATDVDGNPLTYAAVNLPNGASINATTGLFQWTPSSQQAGVYNISFIASDGLLSDTKTATITVVAPSANVSTTAAQLINDLITYMNQTLGDKKANSYTAKLRNVSAKLAAGDKTAALNQMKAFMNEVAAQTGKKINKQAAGIIMAKANAIMTAIDPSYSKSIGNNKSKNNGNGNNGWNKGNNGNNKGNGKGKKK